MAARKRNTQAFFAEELGSLQDTVRELNKWRRQVPPLLELVEYLAQCLESKKLAAYAGQLKRIDDAAAMMVTKSKELQRRLQELQSQMSEALASREDVPIERFEDEYGAILDLAERVSKDGPWELSERLSPSVVLEDAFDVEMLGGLTKKAVRLSERFYYPEEYGQFHLEYWMGPDDLEELLL